MKQNEHHLYWCILNIKYRKNTVRQLCSLAFSVPCWVFLCKSVLWYLNSDNPGKFSCNAPHMKPKEEVKVGSYPWRYFIELVSHLLWVDTSVLHYKHGYELVFYFCRYGLMLSYLYKLYKNKNVYPIIP